MGALSPPGPQQFWWLILHFCIWESTKCHLPFAGYCANPVWGCGRSLGSGEDSSHGQWQKLQLVQAQLQDHTNQCCQPVTNQLLQINPFLLILHPDNSLSSEAPRAGMYSLDTLPNAYLEEATVLPAPSLAKANPNYKRHAAGPVSHTVFFISGYYGLFYQCLPWRL